MEQEIIIKKRLTGFSRFIGYFYLSLIVSMLMSNKEISKCMKQEQTNYPEF